MFSSVFTSCSSQSALKQYFFRGMRAVSVRMTVQGPLPTTPSSKLPKFRFSKLSISITFRFGTESRQQLRKSESLLPGPGAYILKASADFGKAAIPSVKIGKEKREGGRFST